MQPKLQANRVMVFVDGENLVFRYQDMLAAGHRLNPSVLHETDAFVWHPHISGCFSGGAEVVRVGYYTSVVGDDNRVEEITTEISKLVAIPASKTGTPAYQRVVPFVFKRKAKQRKTRIVDVHITVDVLRHVHQDQADTIFLLSADTDYIPLVREVMSRGKRVIVGALSDSATDRLRSTADGFVDLDRWFFLAG